MSLETDNKHALTFINYKHQKDNLILFKKKKTLVIFKHQVNSQP